MYQMEDNKKKSLSLSKIFSTSIMIQNWLLFIDFVM